MKQTIMVILFLLSLTFRVNATGAEETLQDSGNAFFRHCSMMEKSSDQMETSEIMEGTACLSYVGGLEDGIVLEQYDAKTKLRVKIPMPYCLPDSGLEDQQAVRILLKFIRDNPAISHYTTRILFLKAMEDAFPCTSPDSKKNH